MLPILKVTADGKEYSLVELRERLSGLMGLSDADLEEKIPSGIQSKYSNRVYWSTVYLSKAGALSRVRRGVVAITDRGRQLLAQNHPKITVKLLRQFPEFTEFYKGDSSEGTDEPASPLAKVTHGVETPEERLESSFKELRASLASELLDTVKKSTPAFFEDFVVKLLVAMGYGGSVEDAGRAVGKSGDDGIDGIIKEDKLGLDVVYVQAKKWTDTVVGRPVVQSFAGSLEGHRARKGVMITTSTFSQDARDYVQRIEKKIVLIDGKQLAELMIEYDVGVAVAKTYKLKKLDNDFFEPE
ncbi:MAG TPA: restriction endonuclease [Bryobacteraceae bacterium]|nr:restriction endonuclease [Bryobacteraceae bacterium]